MSDIEVFSPVSRTLFDPAAVIQKVVCFIGFRLIYFFILCL